MAEKNTSNVQVVSPVPGSTYTQQIVNVATASTTAVHASHLATGAGTLPGPFTSPVVPRNVTVTFADTWDGGDITVSGTDQFDAAITEVIADSNNATVAGVKIFKTVTGATKQTVGVAAVGASIGTGVKLGLAQRLAAAYGFCMVDAAAPEAATWDATYHAVQPTTAPNNTRDYGLFYPSTS